MKAEEIRAQIDDLKKRHAKVYEGDADAVKAAVYAAPISQAFGIWEIAAQLAEQKESYRFMLDRIASALEGLERKR